jgi:hypothetical protein
MPSTVADTAPFSLTVTAPNNLKVVSSGIRKNDTTFEQPLAAQPFFVVGDYEITTRGGDTLPVEIYASRGLSAAGKAQVQRIAAEAEKMLSFYIKFFGVPANGPFRIISTEARQLGAATTEDLAQSRDTSFSAVGAVLLDDSVFGARRSIWVRLNFWRRLPRVRGLMDRYFCAGVARGCCAMRCRSIYRRNTWASALARRNARHHTTAIAALMGRWRARMRRS